jgi:hypothetical protein
MRRCTGYLNLIILKELGSSFVRKELQGIIMKRGRKFKVEDKTRNKTYAKNPILPYSLQTSRGLRYLPETRFHQLQGNNPSIDVLLAYDLLGRMW